jgi:plastocyanin
MMRRHGLTIGLSVAVAAGLAACSSSTSPNGSGVAPAGGGSSNTITANYSTSGGSYGSGGSASWYFAPTPDTVAAGSSVTFQWSGGAQHSIHWDAVAAPVDSVPTSNNASVSRTFTTPGTYSYHCTIHPMSGMVVVH